MQEFTHFNEQGRAKMVDITDKKSTFRQAVARSSVLVNETIYHKITANKIEKGDVLAVAQVAGVMAAKNTSQWIPMRSEERRVGKERSNRRTATHAGRKRQGEG